MAIEIPLTTDVGEAGRYLREGRVVAFPTGTSYGLAVDALQGWALQRLRNLKGRPEDKTFTVFLREDLWPIFLRLTADERTVLGAFSAKPLTLLVRPADSLAHLAQDGRIGLRVIDHPLMAALAAAVDGPLTATSANRSDEPPCFDPADVQRAFRNPLPDERLDEVDVRGASGTTYDLSLAAILDGGVLPRRNPTTVARVEQRRVAVVREGAVLGEELRGVLS